LKISRPQKESGKHKILISKVFDLQRATKGGNLGQFGFEERKKDGRHRLKGQTFYVLLDCKKIIEMHPAWMCLP
jgi:hypothetical protein